MGNSITGVTFIRDAIRLGYPVDLAVRSVVPHVDEVVVVCDPRGDDGTLECCQALAGEFKQVRVLILPWWSIERGRHCLIEAINAGVEAVTTDWHFFFHPDEALHEDQGKVLKELVAEKEIDGWEFQRLNFHGSRRRVLVQHAMASQVRRLARRSTFPDFRAVNDGTEYAYIGRIPADAPRVEVVGPDRLVIYHYGWVRDPVALISKQRDLADLLGWNWDPVLETWAEDGEVNFDGWAASRKPFKGEHPALWKEWLDEQEERIAAPISPGDLIALAEEAQAERERWSSMPVRDAPPTYPPPGNPPQSESQKYLHQVWPYLQGMGLDIGSGGWPVVPTAIQIELPITRVSTYGPVIHGALPIALRGDGKDLYWFKDAVLDYVFSSHLIEDFDEEQAPPLLKEWARVVKPGGFLVILAAEEERFKAAVAAGQGDNPAHVHMYAVGELTRKVGENLPGWAVLEDRLAHPDDYTVLFVARRNG